MARDAGLKTEMAGDAGLKTDSDSSGVLLKVARRVWPVDLGRALAINLKRSLRLT
jgi:hypothetical protein